MEIVFLGLKREVELTLIKEPSVCVSDSITERAYKLSYFRRRTYRDSCSPLVIKIPRQEDPYPDATSWTVNEVVRFFEEKGFEEQALAFQEQVV